jgi:hypothetical protein
MTINAIATRLLTHFSFEERAIPDSATYPGRNAAVLGAMNGAMQEMFDSSSLWLRQTKRGAILKAPATVNIALTNGSTAGVIDAGVWQDWFAGCTLIVSGSEYDNRITNAERNVVLMLPHEGASGTFPCTIYQDSVALATDVLGVFSPVRIDRRDIFPSETLDAFTSRSSEKDFGFSRQYSGNRIAPQAASTAGRPLTYDVVSWSPSSTTAPASRIRLYPAPDKAYSLDYEAKLLPPAITSLASTDTLPVPHQWIDSIFLPIAEKRLSASPFWQGIIGRDMLAANYTQALELLRSASPRKQRGMTLRPPY